MMELYKDLWISGHAVRSVADLEGALARARKERAQALITNPGPLFDTQQREILDFAAKNRLLAMVPDE